MSPGGRMPEATGSPESPFQRDYLRRMLFPGGIPFRFPRGSGIRRVRERNFGGKHRGRHRTFLGDGFPYRGNNGWSRLVPDRAAHLGNRGDRGCLRVPHLDVPAALAATDAGPFRIPKKPVVHAEAGSAALAYDDHR